MCWCDGAWLNGSIMISKESLTTPDDSGGGRVPLPSAEDKEKWTGSDRALRVLMAHESLVTQALGIERPYLMVDVETRMVKRSEECLNLRSTLAEIAKAEWTRDTKGGPAETIPLPPLMDGLNCRATLRQAQLDFFRPLQSLFCKEGPSSVQQGCVPSP